MGESLGGLKFRNEPHTVLWACSLNYLADRGKRLLILGNTRPVWAMQNNTHINLFMLRCFVHIGCIN